MKIELDRKQAQAVAAACYLASHDWEKGNEYSQEMAKIVKDIKDKIAYAILRNIP